MRALLIESQNNLEALCHKLSVTGVISIDTEFLRVRTYYPKLCLLQIAGEGQVYCVDPLAVDLDTDVLRGVLRTTDQVKVLHAGRQDIEVLYMCCREVPRKIFDTQIAAAMLGLGDQIGYADLVEIVTGTSLAKAHTRTDWCQRPLSPDQLQYAVDDVRYLEAIYQYLVEKLDARGRLEWVFEESESLSDPGLYEYDPESAYKRMGHGQKLEPIGQSVLKALAVWREQTSQAKDLPRNWVVRDSVLATIAHARPSNQNALAALDGISDGFVKRYGAKIINLVNDVVRWEYHPVIWRQGAPLNPDQRALSRQIMAHLRKVSEDSGVSINLLGSRQDVERLVRGRRDVNLLSGWRADLVGDELYAILT